MAAKQRRRTARPKPPRPCRCREQVNEQLQPFNTVLAGSLVLDWQTGKARVAIVISTEKLDPKKRGKARTVLASFCPFCGVKLEEA